MFPRVAARDVPAGRDGAAPLAFVSYADEDHARYGGSINALGAALEVQARGQTDHRHFQVLRDRRHVGWGQVWNNRIADPSDAMVVLIAVVTPAFFRSAQCRYELECFLDREKHLERGDLVLPIRWTDDLDLDHYGAGDPLAREVATRMPDEWPDLRGEPFAAAPVEYWAAYLAGRVRALLGAPGRQPAARPDGPRVPAQPGTRQSAPPPRTMARGTTPAVQPVPSGAVPRQAGPERGQTRQSTARQSTARQSRPPRLAVPPKPPVPPPAGDRDARRRRRYRPIVTSRDLSVKEFSATRLRTGYTMVGVDTFLDRTAAELHRLHSLVRAVENGHRPDPGELVLRVTPSEIRSTTFNPTRFLSGYCEREVDDFLGVVAREFTNLQRFVCAMSGTVPGAALPGRRLTGGGLTSEGLTSEGPPGEELPQAPESDNRPGSYHPGIAGSEVTAKSFTRTRLRVGYKTAQVDEFLAGVSRELDRLHALARAVDGGRRPDPGRLPTGLTPEDISGAVFDTTWLADGYSEYEVDDFLDLLEREVARVRDYLG